MSSIQRQGSETAVWLPRRSCLLIRSLHNGAAPFGDVHEASRSVSRFSQKSMARTLLYHASQLVSARTRESCSLLHCVLGKPVLMPFSSTHRVCLSRFCPAPNLRLDCFFVAQCETLTAVLTPSSCIMSRPSIIHSGGVVC